MHIKTIISFLLIVSLLPGKVSAQRIRSEAITYHYNRLPSHPIDKKFKDYHLEIEAPYEEKNNLLIKEYENKKSIAWQQYLKDSLDYESRVKAAEAKYEREMEEYKKKGLGTKVLEKALLNENNKPVKEVISKPYLQPIEVPFLQTIYDHEILAATYLPFYGFNNSTAKDAIRVLVTLYGFDFTKPRMLSAEKDMLSVGKTTSTYKSTYYHAEFSYRHPMALKVVLPDGKELINLTPQELNIYQQYKTNETDGRQSINPELLIKSKEEKTLQDNMTFIGNLLNDKFGNGPAKREAVLYFVKTKSDEYTDLTSAFNEASSGLQILKDDSVAGKQKLYKAADIWNQALKESDPGNKKARIDKDVTMRIFFNLLEIYFAAGDVSGGNVVLEKLNSMSMDAGERKIKNNFEIFFIDLKKRQQIQLP